MGGAGGRLVGAAEGAHGFVGMMMMMIKMMMADGDHHDEYYDFGGAYRCHLRSRLDDE